MGCFLLLILKMQLMTYMLFDIILDELKGLIIGKLGIFGTE